MNQQRESGLSSSSGVGSQLSILGQVTRELNDIESETPNTLEHILMLKQTGVSDLEVGNRIVEFLQNASLKLNEVTNRGYQQIESSSHDVYNREQALKHWGEICTRVLNALKCLVGNYFERRLNFMGEYYCAANKGWEFKF